MTAEPTPLGMIGRLIEQESARLESRRRELEDAQALIADLATEHRSESSRPAEQGDQSSARVVPRDQVVGVVRHALTSTVGPIRHAVRSISTLPARDEAVVRLAQDQVVQGRVVQTVYPTRFLRDDDGYSSLWVRDWAEVGERQRLVDEVPHAFTVFGDELVLACTQWGVVTDDLVAIRAPMLVQSFVAVFDAAWTAGLPVPPRSYDDADNDRLLTMLASGLKDEAIARYLGVSLRTVRRRVALMMELMGAHTRFQLGIAAERRGLLGPRDGTAD
jgi:DNA-binding CsgD family transcriptional regulator